MKNEIINKPGFAIFTFILPYTDNRETVLFKYGYYIKEDENIKLCDLQILDKKFGDFIEFEKDKWHAKGLNGEEYIPGVYETNFEEFKLNTLYNINDEDEARLIFEVYE